MKPIMGVRFAGLAAAALLGVAGAGTAAAGPRAQIQDPVGDVVAGQSWADLTSVRFSLVRKAAAQARFGPDLVVTATLAGAPSRSEGVRYVVNARSQRCGDLTFVATTSVRGITATVVPACGTRPVQADVTLGAHTVSWRLGLYELPEGMGVGTVLNAFDAFVDVSEPLVGALGTGDAWHQLSGERENPTHGRAVLDYGRGQLAWTVR